MRCAAVPLLSVAALAAVAFAQTPEARDRETNRPRPREEVFRMVDGYLIGNLQERLGLTNEQFARVMPQVKRLQGNRRELAQRRIRAMQDLRRLLMSGTATEAQVEEQLRQVKEVERDEPAALRRDMDAVDEVLSPVQQAKYRLLEAEVERKIRRAMRRMRLPPSGARPRDGSRREKRHPKEPR
jgi:Spy/CpxP family protein refolding chaperone